MEFCNARSFRWKGTKISQRGRGELFFTIFYDESVFAVALDHQLGDAFIHEYTQKRTESEAGLGGDVFAVTTLGKPRARNARNDSDVAAPNNRDSR